MICSINKLEIISIMLYSPCLSKHNHEYESYNERKGYCSMTIVVTFTNCLLYLIVSLYSKLCLGVNCYCHDTNQHGLQHKGHTLED